MFLCKIFFRNEYLSCLVCMKKNDFILHLPVFADVDDEEGSVGKIMEGFPSKIQQPITGEITFNPTTFELCERCKSHSPK